MARPIPSARPSWSSPPPNPVDYEGTFPLPLRQLDRFLMRIHIANSRPQTNARFCASLPQTTTAAPSTRSPPTPKLALRKNPPPLSSSRTTCSIFCSKPSPPPIPRSSSRPARARAAAAVVAGAAPEAATPITGSVTSIVCCLPAFVLHSSRAKNLSAGARATAPSGPNLTTLRRAQPAYREVRRPPAQTGQGALTLFPRRHWSFNSELWLSLPRPYPAQLNRSIAIANATSRSVMRLPASCVFSRSTTRLYTF